MGVTYGGLPERLMNQVMWRAEGLEKSLHEVATVTAQFTGQKNKLVLDAFLLESTELGGKLRKCVIPGYLSPSPFTALSFASHGGAESVGVIKGLWKGLAFGTSAATRNRVVGVAFDFDDAPVNFSSKETATPCALAAGRCQPLLHPWDESFFRN